MVDSSVIYNVVINFQQKMGEKSLKIVDNMNKSTMKMGKIFTGINKLFQQSAVRLFSLIFLMRRMQQAVVGLLKPAADMVGITDVWNMTLGLFFLPIMEALLPIVLAFSDWLIGLPQPLQLAVGGATVFAAALLSVGTIILGVIVGLSALGGGSITAGLAMAASLAPVAVALAGLPLLIAALIAIWESLGSTGTKVAETLLAGFVYLAVFANGTLMAGIGGILKMLGLIGTVGVSSVALIIGSILAAVTVLFLLRDKFGSFGNALKAWAGGLVLAIAFVIQSTVNGILTLIGLVLTALGWLTKKAADAARAAGFDTIAGKLQGASDALFSGAGKAFEGVDLMSPTASALDKYGFNPQAVNNSTGLSNQISTGSSADTSNGANVTVVNNNTFNVADWQQYQAKMAEQQRKMEADIKRQLAAGQT